MKWRPETWAQWGRCLATSTPVSTHSQPLLTRVGKHEGVGLHEFLSVSLGLRKFRIAYQNLPCMLCLCNRISVHDPDQLTTFTLDRRLCIKVENRPQTSDQWAHLSSNKTSSISTSQLELINSEAPMLNPSSPDWVIILQHDILSIVRVLPATSGTIQNCISSSRHDCQWWEWRGRPASSSGEGQLDHRPHQLQVQVSLGGDVRIQDKREREDPEEETGQSLIHF